MKASPIGLKRGVIRLDPYTRLWAECFRKEAERLREGLGQSIGHIEHIGSTAVPDLIAKPIIDIMASVDHFEEVHFLIPEVEALGYAYGENDEIPDRHYFRLKPADGITTHHLSLAEMKSLYWKHQMLFRNYLRARPEVRRQYAEIKQKFAFQHAGDCFAYVEAKTEFVTEILDLAGKESDEERK